MWLLVGLGNPGLEYRDNRHNIGFMVADELCRRAGADPGSYRGKFGAQMISVSRYEQPIHILKPMEYMNCSGRAVGRAAAFYQASPRQIVVVHDDIDLPFGRIKVKVGGGHGGHNGLRSISETIGPDYLRVRCGVGRPSGGKERVVSHVLGPFSKAEQKELPHLVDLAADAAEAIIKDGPTLAMNRYNVEPPSTTD